MAQQLGVVPVSMGRVLDPIQDYCIEHQLPPLTILAISKITGLPGDGFIAWDPERLPEGRREVYAYSWRIHGNPYAYALNGSEGAELVEKTLAKDPDLENIYERCGGSRGALQTIFRGGLMKAYGGRCAFSGSTAVQALEAAHIVPWTEATKGERVDPANGLLLNAYYHRLFDAGILTIDEHLKIVLTEPSFLEGVSELDQHLVTQVVGEKIKRPQFHHWWPNKLYIARHNERLGL